jgi:gliding motility-associated-like protein
MTTSLTLSFRKLKSIWHLLMVPLMMIFTLVLLFLNSAHAEGSADFLIWPGKRLFLSTDEKQQLKVFAKAGEFLNVGASHVAVSGGTISVYAPNGTKIKIFDGADGKTAIMFDSKQEKAGPTGEGTKNAGGYVPGVIPITEEGVYTVTFDFPGYDLKVFKNLEMQAPWTRAVDQPTIMRVITGYDLTISQNGAGNTAGSKLLKGRVYTNEHVSAVNENGNLVNPSYYILTKDGYQYYVDFVDVDPWGFPMSSSSTGMVTKDMKPVYKSLLQDLYTRSSDPKTWQSGKNYFYEPQAEDYGAVVNNKIFFNPPSTDLPSTAKVTDIFRKNTHITWLLNKPQDGYEFKAFEFKSATATCKGAMIVPGKGGFIKFTSNYVGDLMLRLDLNDNKNFYDSKDIAISKTLKGGVDSIFWNGNYGDGTPIPIGSNFKFNFKMDITGGEIHIMMFDIENNPGGIKFKRLNGINSPDSTFYYDHAQVGDGVSGGGTAGNPLPQTTPYTYSNNWGNLKMLDYWAYVNKAITSNNTFTIAVMADCIGSPTVNPSAIIDTDGDKIPDVVDLDDDNDGISDLMEFCHTIGGGFTCLPGAKDPAGDEDNDGIPNFLDANDPKVPNNMPDTNKDGKCDFLNPLYDTDVDQVPDFLDLDSDNDGITDLAEAQHNQPDVDGNGIIDGLSNAFGINGLYDKIDSDPSSLTSVMTYIPRDFDKDGLPDHDDLDSDNDGINDIAEQLYGIYDIDNDGRFDPTGQNLTPSQGLVPQIDPAKTGKPIPNPLDFDKDGVPDWHDFDSDNDGIMDVTEADRPDLDPDNNGMPGTGKPKVDAEGQVIDLLNPNIKSTSDIRDTDNDKIPDFHDLDSDGDNLLDTYEADIADPDFDGLIGTGKPTVNTYGVAAGAKSNPTDTDKDGKPDFRDLDSDDDTLPDATECNAMPCMDLDKDGKPAFRDDDRDGDGLWDGYECSTKGIACEDSDADGTPDVDDLDSDNDTLPDATECGNQSKTCGDLDKDGKPNFRDDDRDGDGLWDGYECTTKGIGCEDTDKDGTPDVDDLDSDNDTLPDATECGNQSKTCSDLDNDGKPAFRDDDRDGDGLWDGYECTSKGIACVDTDKDGTPDVDDLDSDNDSLPDATECGNQSKNCADLDGDGQPNFRDIDRDGDGINDGYECSTKGIGCEDTDKDGTPDVDDLDSDNDGLPDVYECGKPNNCPDFDNDGTPDFRDLDSDNDGKSDKIECPTGAPCLDADGDGFPNFRDVTCDKILDLPILAYQTPICNGIININILQNYPNLDRIIWFNGVGDTLSKSSQKNLTLSADSPEAISPYFVKIYDKDGCRSNPSEKANIKVNILPKDIKLSAKDDSADGKQNNSFIISVLDNDQTDNKNEWTLSIATPPKNGKAIVQNGQIVYMPSAGFFGDDVFEYKICYKECSDICKSAKVSLKVAKIIEETPDPNNKDCTVPNIFTPNGDGANDFLKIKCLDTYKNSELAVFNRWGNEVYRSHPYQNNWEGTFNGDKLPAGTYYYIFKPDRDGTECQMGYITLLRN